MRVKIKFTSWLHPQLGVMPVNEVTPLMLEAEIEPLNNPKPIAWFYPGSNDEPMSVALDKDLDEAQKANCLPLYFGSPV